MTGSNKGAEVNEATGDVWLHSQCASAGDVPHAEVPGDITRYAFEYFDTLLRTSGRAIISSVEDLSTASALPTAMASALREAVKNSTAYELIAVIKGLEHDPRLKLESASTATAYSLSGAVLATVCPVPLTV